MIDRDDSWELTFAITGDEKLATENYFTEHVVGMIKALREERDHLLSQLAAARAHVEVVEVKRTNHWTKHDVETLNRLLAEGPKLDWRT